MRGEFQWPRFRTSWDAVVVEAADVAVACCRRTAGAAPGDLYPDPDAGPLRAALAAIGATSALVAWDDPTPDWAAFPVVLVSSTWDSVDRPSEYLAWARSTAAVTSLRNPVAALEWNLDKIYLRDLEADGVEVVPTVWVTPRDTYDSARPDEYVVKPSIGAGGRNTARYRRGDPAGLAHVQALQALGQTVMVQDYLSMIDTEGESDLIFVDGRFSHAVGKVSALHLGQGVVERPWERMTWTGLTVPSARQLATPSERWRSCPAGWTCSPCTPASTSSQEIGAPRSCWKSSSSTHTSRLRWTSKPQRNWQERCRDSDHCRSDRRMLGRRVRLCHCR